MDSLGGYLPYAVSGLIAAGSAYFFLNRKSNVSIKGVGYRAGQPTQTWLLYCRTYSRPQGLQEL